MEQQDNNLTPLDQDDVQLLSKRNQKRFNKLLPQIEQRIINLKNENQLLTQEVAAAKTPEVIEKKVLVSEYDKAHKEYLKAQIDSEETETQLSAHSSSTSNYGSEIILFSVIIGLVFDFLLWKDIFAGKFGDDDWAERAERASAVILSFSYAFICAQLGASYAIKIFTKKRSESTVQKEIEIYNKSTSKNSLGINAFLFLLLTILSTAARFTQNSLNISDKFILSLAATSIGLVISAIGYWYTDVYEHYIKIAKSKELKAKKNFYRLQKIAKDKNNAD
ncbi:MAG: hypothetical protein O3A39_03990 [Proteobacteria bacterium]|nr:hypothetical protein [Pseudomonadota bacterium]